jgi:hypothetical protein
MPTCIPAFLQAHWGVISGIGVYVLLTCIRHLPPPGTKITVYEYCYDVTQSLMATPALQALGNRFAPPAPPVVK